MDALDFGCFGLLTKDPAATVFKDGFLVVRQNSKSFLRQPLSTGATSHEPLSSSFRCTSI